MELSWEALASLPIPIVALEEQRIIVKYLDNEIRHIDTLISTKRRMLELLEEKRMALITQAVSKGLDSSAKMMDSGAAWIGLIPAHWKTGVKFQYLARAERNSFVNGPFGSDLLTNELIDDGIPVLYSGDIRESGFEKKSFKYVTEEKAKQLDFCRADPGCLLLAKVGDPPGCACIYPQGEPVAIVTQDVVRVRLDARIVDPHYIADFLNSKIGKQYISFISVKATRGRFSLADLKSIRIFMPPRQEQEEIAAYLNEQDGLIKAQKDKINAAIELLFEYRSALITNAVTGKIDVRGLAEKEAAA